MKPIGKNTTENVLPILVALFWGINKIFQILFDLSSFKILNFFLIHNSSLFASFLITYLIFLFKKSKALLILPFLIEEFHSRYFLNRPDEIDSIFSIIGSFLGYFYFSFFNSTQPR
jgi:hypothetical protein